MQTADRADSCADFGLVSRSEKQNPATTPGAKSLAGRRAFSVTENALLRLLSE
ncbi:hypothetical protein ACFO5X_14835 [Seohaeicola nanhaiensis]|uniref:Uncharacterized protein n=1 Tax=Seohaeicola nanhaiensis TaxID=1387282 RepID=A0ABV9KI43_9RHOB